MSRGKNKHPFQGFSAPNYTPVPDELFDDLLSKMSGAETKVVLYIIRRTLGFKKPSDSISIKQMVHGITTRDGTALDHGTGLAPSTALAAVKSLVQHGVIVAVHNRSADQGDQPTTYQPRFKDPVPENRRGGSTKIEDARPRKSKTQETVEQETDRQETVSSKFHISNGAAAQATAQHIVENVPRGQIPVPVTRAQARSERVDVLVTEISQEFADTEHLRANCSQANRLLVASRMSENAFEQLLYMARSVTRNELHARPRSDRAPLHHPMAYFFSVVRRDLELVAPKPNEPAADKEPEVGP